MQLERTQEPLARNRKIVSKTQSLESHELSHKAAHKLPKPALPLLSSDQGLQANTYQVSIPNPEVWRCWENGNCSNIIHLLRLSSALCKKTKGYTHQISSREISWKGKVTISNRCFKHYCLIRDNFDSATLESQKVSSSGATSSWKFIWLERKLRTGQKAADLNTKSKIRTSF